MSRQTLNLGSGFSIVDSQRFTTVRKYVSAGPINSALVNDSIDNPLSTAYVSVFYTKDTIVTQSTIIVLHFGVSATDTGQDLTTAWENYSRAVKLAIQGGASITVGGPNYTTSQVKDSSEPYAWQPSNHAALKAWAKQVNSSSVILLTLNDGVTAPTTPTALKFRASLDGSIFGSLRASLRVTDTPATDPVEPVEPPVSANALKFGASLGGNLSGAINASLRLGSVTVRPRPRPRPRDLKFLANLDGNIYGYINANSELSLVLNSVVNLDGDLQGIINASLVVTGLYKPIINLRYESGSVILDVPTGI